MIPLLWIGLFVVPRIFKNLQPISTKARHSSHRSFGAPITKRSLRHQSTNCILSSASDPFYDALIQNDWSADEKVTIVESLQALNLYSSTSTTVQGSFGPLLAICQGLNAAEVSQMLIRDFQINPLMANQIRSVVMSALERHEQEPEERMLPMEPLQQATSTRQYTTMKAMETGSTKDPKGELDTNISPERQQPRYKAVVVNQAAAVRRRNKTNTYKLEMMRFPSLSNQLDQFYQFMTEPSILSQEDPIRPATANVYMVHAKLYLGWYVAQQMNEVAQADASLSLQDILSSKDKDSATAIIQFVMWLRKERQISVNYEANLLRGIIKLLKFCFASESVGGDNRKTYEDIPVIQELRRLHRNAHKQAKLAPKSSNEGQKWLSWPEYLRVVQATKADFDRLVVDAEHSLTAGTRSKSSKDALKSLQRKVAAACQRYLVLAIFTNVPDRQRTIRELEIGRTLIKEESVEGCWFIKHNPGDYKTGETYGERPPMMLSAALSKDVDEFVGNWRPKLEPSTSFLFVQPKTGNPFSRDSVYQTVSRACYQHAGKRTNPHLLRDMIVTHVRESDASEKELESLALFMGHSIQMQRTSYDRRTLERKIAPAIELLQSVNGEEYSRKEE
ncbi:hypothetical protein MPSEU_000780100 [Mayamaea pseudoterrestris]|nr:hypothetical protein MPSEU_000780100 [Mayamaea pseudoterrestris]